MHKRREVLDVKEVVSSRSEVSVLMKEFDGGPILYFDNVKGHETKIVAGFCGARQRLGWALGATTEIGIDATRPLTKPREKFKLTKIPASKRTTKIIDELKKTPERKRL